MTTELKIATSPISNAIYACRVNSKNIMVGDKIDVTDTAIPAVAIHLMQTKENVQLTLHDGKTYILSLKEVAV